jgi:hypothetical protein
MGNPEVPRDDEARAFPPPPPPAQRPTPTDGGADDDVPGVSVTPAEEADAGVAPAAMPDDLEVSADLAMARVDDLDIPPADIAVPDFTIPDPPEIPPLDPTAAVLLEDEKAAVSTEVPPPATRSELRARTTAGESAAGQAPFEGGNAVPESASDPAPTAASETPASDPSRPHESAGASAPAPGRPAASPVSGTPGVPPAPGSPTAPPIFAAEQPPAAFAPAAPFGQATDASASDLSNPRGGDTYRGWPIVVFIALAALLIAAVIGILVLVNNPPSIAASGGSGTGIPEPVTVDEVSESGCSDLCAEISTAVKSTITGRGGVVWTTDEDWQDAAAPVASASGATSASFTSTAGELRLSVIAFADDDVVAAAGEELGAQRSEPLTSESSVYDDGTGTSRIYADGAQQAIIWHVPSADAAPRLMLIEGPDDEAVFDFYLALPF